MEPDVRVDMMRKSISVVRMGSFAVFCSCDVLFILWLQLGLLLFLF